MGKTFRKIQGNGNFKSISFVESHQPLEVFKPPLNLTQTKPMNYDFNQNDAAKKNTHTDIYQQHQYDVTQKNPMNYNFNQYDVAKKNPLIYTQNDISPINYNFNQQHQYDVT